MAESKKVESKPLVKDVVINDSKEPEKNEPSLTRIYIGPNLLQLTKYTVIDGELPTHIKEVTEKCPAIKKLIVPVAKLVELEKKCGVKGTLEHKQYEEIMEFLQGRSE